MYWTVKKNNVIYFVVLLCCLILTLIVGLTTYTPIVITGYITWRLDGDQEQNILILPANSDVKAITNLRYKIADSWQSYTGQWFFEDNDIVLIDFNNPQNSVYTTAQVTIGQESLIKHIVMHIV